jgi:hypothetical protein
MTQDERNLLTDLANRFAQTPAPPKDQEAEDFIRTRIGSRPDALYLMTQTVLIQNMALQHAQQQIQELQQRAGQPTAVGSGGSFLGGSQPGQAPPRSPNYGGGAQQYSAPPPQYAAPSPSAASPSGAPSFLKGAAQTAAGVAAGALAFEGIQSLFSHPGYGGGSGFGGFGGGGGFGAGGLGGGETIVNNYYDDPAADVRNDSDISNVDDSQQFDDSASDASYDTGGDDGGSFDSGGGDNFV